MSTLVDKKLNDIKNRAEKLKSEAPFMARRNPFYNQVVALFDDLLDVIELQQGQLDALKHDQYSRGDL